MNYYYDIILNWNEEEGFNFYEWIKSDYLESIKRIPIVRVKHKTFIEIIENKIKVNNEFLNSIKDKTLINGNNIINKIEYAVIFTDAKNMIAIEFNKEGISTTRSKFLIEEELSALEVFYNLKEMDIEIEILEKCKRNKGLRQENEAKKMIALEIKNLYEKKELSKLRYLYYEYKKEKCEDINFIYEDLMKDLSNTLNNHFWHLYNIIKLSYHNV